MGSSIPNGGGRPDSNTDGRRFLTPPAPRLRLRVTDVPGETDRATLSPADATDVERMETWLSIDAGVLRDLAGCR